MMEKSALAGEGGGVHAPTPCHSILPSRTKWQCTIRSSWEGRHTSYRFHLYPTCILWCPQLQSKLISLRPKNLISNQWESQKNRFASKSSTKTRCFLLNVRICVASSFENKNEQHARETKKNHISETLLTCIFSFSANQFTLIRYL